uniref:F-box domain-containing protein n=1 Tax=Chromera velia CCMP2878 TaxID=1169474 RepID=A0A0G4F2D7_9ALVE|eukprot:Cvel_14706.t1-p1 / transcript=Cvel_14706.t1 / gene=Cvel_14706 / organism=Chromera_velia_CCMP2878 / gene_product=hypothetical protein / transcript_product=hypothetical protein / location=Cvel_scaffold1056:28175-32057(-) / protein_length=914 / sequence_SO=supercontig / SO=protein_coding / is_pseudo=false
MLFLSDEVEDHVFLPIFHFLALKEIASFEQCSQRTQGLLKPAETGEFWKDRYLSLRGEGGPDVLSPLLWKAVERDGLSLPGEVWRDACRRLSLLQEGRAMSFGKIEENTNEDLARETASLFLDDSREWLFLYGGWGRFGPCNDLFVRSVKDLWRQETEKGEETGDGKKKSGKKKEKREGGGWTRVTIEGRPPRRSYGQSLAPIGENRFLIVGGYLSGGYFGESDDWSVLRLKQQQQAKERGDGEEEKGDGEGGERGTGGQEGGGCPFMRPPQPPASRSGGVGLSSPQWSAAWEAVGSGGGSGCLGFGVAFASLTFVPRSCERFPKGFVLMFGGNREGRRGAREDDGDGDEMEEHVRGAGEYPAEPGDNAMYVERETDGPSNRADFFCCASLRWVDAREANALIDPSGERPQARNAHSAVLSPDGRYIILAGGGTGTNVPRGGDDLTDIWRLDLQPGPHFPGVEGETGAVGPSSSSSSLSGTTSRDSVTGPSVVGWTPLRWERVDAGVPSGHQLRRSLGRGHVAVVAGERVIYFGGNRGGSNALCRLEIPSNGESMWRLDGVRLVDSVPFSFSLSRTTFRDSAKMSTEAHSDKISMFPSCLSSPYPHVLKRTLSKTTSSSSSSSSTTAGGSSTPAEEGRSPPKVRKNEREEGDGGATKESPPAKAAVEEERTPQPRPQQTAFMRLRPRPSPSSSNTTATTPPRLRLPAPRAFHGGVFTGTEVIIFGGWHRVLGTFGDLHLLSVVDPLRSRVKAAVRLREEEEGGENPKGEEDAAGTTGRYRRETSLASQNEEKSADGGEKEQRGGAVTTNACIDTVAAISLEEAFRVRDLLAHGSGEESLSALWADNGGKTFSDALNFDPPVPEPSPQSHFLRFLGGRAFAPLLRQIPPSLRYRSGVIVNDDEDEDFEISDFDWP